MKYWEHEMGDCRARRWNLYLITDLHWTITKHSMAYEAWREYRRRAISDPFGIYLCLGDMMEAFRRHVTNDIKRALVTEEESLEQDEMYKLQVRHFIETELAAFPRSRWIGAVDSNHQYVFSDGSTATQYMCQEMGIPYLGEEGNIWLVWRSPCNKDKTRYSVGIVAKHSMGNGKLASIFNNMQKDVLPKYPESRIIACGHIHANGNTWDEAYFKLGAAKHLFRTKRVYLVASSWQVHGSLESGYIPEKNKVLKKELVSYAESKNFHNNGTGGQIITIDVGQHRHSELGRDASRHAKLVNEVRLGVISV